MYRNCQPGPSPAVRRWMQVGTKLLYVEVGVASDLVGKLLHGKSLSRCGPRP